MRTPLERAARAGLLVLATGLGLAACGPNYRYVYDGEVAFERCYALDYDASAQAAERSQCWSQWLAYYTYGQTPERISYARTRATNPGPPPGGGNGGPGPGWSASGNAPSPTSLATLANGPSGGEVATGPVPSPTSPGPAERPVVSAREDPTTSNEARLSGGGNPIGAPPPTQPPSTASSDPPGAACAGDCRTTWNTCGGQCPSTQAVCVARCDDAFRDCMRGCY